MRKNQDFIVKSIEKIKTKPFIFGEDLEKKELLYRKDKIILKSIFRDYLKLEKENIWVKDDFYFVSDYINSMIDYITHKDIKRKTPKLKPGNIVLANLSLGYKNEPSFIGPVMILSVYGRNRIFVVPILENYGFIKNAYHYKNNVGGSKRHYLLTEEESATDKKSVFILDSCQMISTSRITFEEKVGNIEVNSRTFKDIKELIFQRTLPTEYRGKTELENEIKELKDKIEKLKSGK
ncbi:type II toxin-antitoxin system PemK/MazF family toxin [Planococcus versutus]|uniref:Uncharacterized protein n=1 Tax=Planococcus versutus TaxID=1302659 RepID=A0A1B1S3A0_9BACL|nr:type II toxin-antitoxin system PemK/MazF family toxin [Planococcus versutus]ANU27666.1 hypothetical protein I858_011780 [Planococcus versutus]